MSPYYPRQPRNHWKWAVAFALLAALAFGLWLFALVEDGGAW